MTGAVDQRRRQRAADTERDARARATQRAANAVAARTIAEIEARGGRADEAIGGRGQQGMEQLMRILGVRVRRVMEALDGPLEGPESIGPNVLADRIGGALAYVDALDEELSLVEGWLNRVGSAVPGDRVASRRRNHREALGMPGAAEQFDLLQGKTRFDRFAQQVMGEVSRGLGLSYEQMAVKGGWVQPLNSGPGFTPESFYRHAFDVAPYVAAASPMPDPDPYAFARERYGVKIRVGSHVRFTWQDNPEKWAGVVVEPEPGSTAVRVKLSPDGEWPTVNVDARCVEVIHD